MPAQIENGRKFDGIELAAIFFRGKEMYLHLIDQSLFESVKKVLFSLHLSVHTKSLSNVPVRAPFSKSTVSKIYRQKMCRFRVNGWNIRQIFRCFQNEPASSCERSLSVYC